MKIDHKESYPDFGKQFLKDNQIDDYWGSKEMLIDIVNPFNLRLIKGKTVMEVGIGSGRIIKNLLKFFPKRIFAIEPSEAISVAKKNNIKDKEKIEYININAKNIKIKNEIDYVFSLGVIHHIPNYKIACSRIYDSIKPKGKFIMWVYGYEGNELYIFIFNNLRRITRILPDGILRVICYILNFFCSIYIFLCRFFNLPMKSYMLNVFKKCSFKKRNYIIFDQLNPSYSKYFKKEEVLSLLKDTGFKKVSIYARYNYSWLAIAEK